MIPKPSWKRTSKTKVRAPPWPAAAGAWEGARGEAPIVLSQCSLWIPARRPVHYSDVILPYEKHSVRDIIQVEAAETGQQHDAGNPDGSFSFHSVSKQNQVSRAAASFTPAQKCAGGGWVRFSEGVLLHVSIHRSWLCVRRPSWRKPWFSVCHSKDDFDSGFP